VTQNQTTKFSTRKHRRRLWVGWALGCLLAVVGVATGLRYPSATGRSFDERLTPLVGGIVAGVVICGVVIAIAVPILFRRLDMLVQFVSRARPGAAIIPGSGSKETRRDARRVGVSVRRLGGTSILALAVLPDHIEVWARKDLTPRWTISRAGAEVGIISIEHSGVGLKTRSLPGIRVSDGERSVHLFPGYPGLDRPASRERALRDLGADPADHIEP
jgi:hypothetical protein